MTQEKRPIKWWDTDPTADELFHETIDEAVQKWVDSEYRSYDKPFPERVAVYGYTPMELPSAEIIADKVLEDLSLLLDDWNDPMGNNDLVEEKHIIEAAEALARAVREHADVWACEVVETREVWVRDHVPEEWLSAAAKGDGP